MNKQLSKYINIIRQSLIGNDARNVTRHTSTETGLITVRRRTTHGFTLVELLAVIGVFMVIGTLIMTILVTSLRTANKTNLIGGVRTNGNYAISEMSKLIRNARVLESPYPCGTPDNPTTTTSATITTPEDLFVTFACINGTVASNGASLIDTTTAKVTACLFTCTQDNPSDYPVVNIRIALTQATSGFFAENQASTSAIPFETSVVLRNLNR